MEAGVSVPSFHADPGLSPGVLGFKHVQGCDSRAYQIDLHKMEKHTMVEEAMRSME